MENFPRNFSEKLPKNFLWKVVYDIWHDHLVWKLSVAAKNNSFGFEILLITSQVLCPLFSAHLKILQPPPSSLLFRFLLRALLLLPALFRPLLLGGIAVVVSEQTSLLRHLYHVFVVQFQHLLKNGKSMYDLRQKKIFFCNTFLCMRAR